MNIQLAKYNWAIIAVGIVIFTAIFLGWIHDSLAYEVVDQENYVSTSTGVKYYQWLQYFTPEENNISSLNLWTTATTSMSDVMLYICKGPYDATVTFLENQECTGNAQTEIKSVYYPSITALNDGWTNFDFTDTDLIADAVNYFFSISGYTPVDSTFGFASSDDYYDGGICHISSGSDASDWDLNFQTLYDTDFIPSEYQGVEIIDLDNTHLDDWEVEIMDSGDWDDFDLSFTADFQTVESQLCYISTTTPCKLWFHYNDLALGSTMYLTPDVQYQQNPTHSLDDVYLTDDVSYAMYVTVPQESTATSVDYCLYLDAELDNVQCGITIRWITSSYFDQFHRFEYDIESACFDVASSTGDFFDDFRYGIECGFRKFTYWALNPQDDVYEQYQDAVNDVQNSFPMSVINQIQLEVLSLQDVTASSVSINAGFLDESLEDAILFDVDMVPDALGLTWDVIYTWIIYLMYGALGLYIIFDVLKVTR